MKDIIFQRRSVRFFKADPISEENLREILRAGMWAPSPKNRQPWKFIAVSGKSKEDMLSAMAEGIVRSEKGKGVLSGTPELYSNARFTLQCMTQAPVTVFVVNPEGRSLHEGWDVREKIHELSDVQAIGAAAENMALMATSLGIGSLWIGDIFFAEEELSCWLGAGQMVLAMSFGYANHHPVSLARKPEDAVIEIRD